VKSGNTKNEFSFLEITMFLFDQTLFKTTYFEFLSAFFQCALAFHSWRPFFALFWIKRYSISESA